MEKNKFNLELGVLLKTMNPRSDSLLERKIKKDTRTRAHRHTHACARMHAHTHLFLVILTV